MAGIAQPAADFDLQQLDSTTDSVLVDKHSLADLQGQVVYLDFWASWCKPCRQSFPWMNRISTKYAEQGLVVLAINLDKESHLAKQFLAKYPAQFPIIYDPSGKIASQYRIPGMPTSYLIDKHGQLRIAHKGFHLQKAPDYEAEIVSLLNE
ncbi:TlpA disulfide reductase family protein [Aliiglaciecola litoralis]|uniref:TlpA disulfide reductase family protein n=1 Tax=Aliiglaciecola litoralis TaxID=582857 RepID=A0ABP3WSH8_9ALTE